MTKQQLIDEQVREYHETHNVDCLDTEPSCTHLKQSLTTAYEAGEREGYEKAEEWILAYKQKYRGMGMADSMLALDELLSSLTPTDNNKEIKD